MAARADCIWIEPQSSSTLLRDHFGFAVVDEAFEEGAHGGVVVSCGQGGHEEGAFEACASAPVFELQKNELK
jgi:hypothetical protein